MSLPKTSFREDKSEYRDDDVYRTLSTFDYGDIVLNPDGSVNVAATDYALGAAVETVAINWKDGHAVNAHQEMSQS